jgi:3-hydroxyacyl-CoA dehydrogenase/uncharacterized OB-fold protein
MNAPQSKAASGLDAIEFPEAVPFWQAAAQGRLLIKHCDACQQHYYFPRPLCPFCMSDRTTWLEASGKGTVYSYTVTGQARAQVATAIVELEEGPRLTVPLVDSDVHSLSVGQAVRVVFPAPADGGPARPAFMTMEASQAHDYLTAATKLATHRPATSPAPPIRHAAVIGSGTMGTGIAMSLANAGISIVLIDHSPEALERGLSLIRKNYAASVSKGSLQQEAVDARLRLLSTSMRFEDLSQADVVIEAVWEQMELKKDVFRKIDAHAKPGAILGTNTSALDINEIAASVSRPESVIGLHFFSPAHVMRLLEVVRGDASSDAVIAGAMALGLQLGKVPVLVGVCDGFVGNRLLKARGTQAQRLLIEGALPQDIDAVLRKFGFPMGLFQMLDMAAAIELNYRRRQATGEKHWLIDNLFHLGRTGLKVGRGYYRYEEGKRDPLPDPEVTQLIEQASRQEGVTRRVISEHEILERLLYPMVNEGAKLISERIVAQGSDIDVVWSNGYGWPKAKGGPMYWADTVGIEKIRRRMLELSAIHGASFTPAPLIDSLAESGQTFVNG